MRVLSIGADRSRNGINVHDSRAWNRQKAYADALGSLDIVNYTLRADRFKHLDDGALRIFPTSSVSKIMYGLDALRIQRGLPQPAVVTAQDPHLAGLLALWIARRRGVPLHIQMHTDIFTVAYSALSISNFIRLHIALYVLTRADAIRVVSERIKASVVERLTPKRPIRVLPIFVDVQKFATSQGDPQLHKRFSQYARVFLFVGRLEREKNCALAIKSFAMSAGADDCLVIVGDGSERQKLGEIADEFGVAGRVFFEGTKDPLPYYKAADLVLVTSEFEGYGLVIVEALASGTPVLSTDVGVARESGALVCMEDGYQAALKQWIVNGPRDGRLVQYPYSSFQQYVSAYCDDLKQTRNSKL